MDRGAWRAKVHAVARVGHGLAAKLQITTRARSTVSMVSTM